MKKYETRADDFWRRAETALLTALCVYAYTFFNEQTTREKMLKEYFTMLSLSNREKKDTWIDMNFNCWGESWPNDEAVVAYDAFCSLEPNTQRLVILGCQSLLTAEAIEQRPMNKKARNDK